MRNPLIVLLISVALVLTACGSDEADATMPEVVGEHLDIALSGIERAGYNEDPEIIGGGMFGVVDESNWVVCEQLPEPGSVIEGEPRLTVDRDCNLEEGEEPTEEEPAEPEEGDTGEEEVPDADASEATAKPNKSVDADAVLAQVLGSRGTVEGMCDSVKQDDIDPQLWYFHWSCWFEGVTADSGDLWIELSTDGGRSSGEIEDLVDKTAIHWWNFIGCDFKSLTTMVVTVNGLDHNRWRRDFPLASSSC